MCNVVARRAPQPGSTNQHAVAAVRSSALDSASACYAVRPTSAALKRRTSAMRGGSNKAPGSPMHDVRDCPTPIVSYGFFTFGVRVLVALFFSSSKRQTWKCQQGVRRSAFAVSMFWPKTRLAWFADTRPTGDDDDDVCGSQMWWYSHRYSLTIAC